MNKEISRPVWYEGRHRMSRRKFLSPLALAPVYWRAALRASEMAQSGDTGIQGSDFVPLQTLFTPNDKFFIRNHFAAPRLSLQGWTLRVVGRVRSPLELRYADILSHPARNLTATLECAGNGVSFAGVGTATWTGIPLETLLKEARVSSGAKQIRLVGADRGAENPSQTPVTFIRSIPLEKALHPDTLLAFRMNAAPLPPEHGYPLRAMVPGWYGMDSVKWLVRIEVLDQPDTSYFMTQRYIAVRLETIGSRQQAIARMRVKSLIAQPREGEILPPGLHTIRGAAWAGENRVVQVEVSTDGGKDWASATLEQDAQSYTWVLWNYLWDVRVPGAYTIMVRATDDLGNTQPSSRNPLRVDAYEMNWYHSVRCEVS